MICVDEFIERPARELDHAIVDRRLKASLGLLCDGVHDLVERIADGNLRGYFGDGIARCLRSERGRSADARIDLDDIVAIALRIERILCVAAALDAELSDDALALRSI